MKVLVAVASRHGSTREIGEAIGEVIAGAGFVVDVHDPDDVESLEGYDAVVLGSSVYVGRWAASARAMVDRLAAGLSSRPVWLFSSGPVGVPAVPAGDPEEVGPLMTRLGARGHRTFAGALDRGGLGMAERAVVALVKAEHGDFRRWEDIQDWAQQIVEELSAEIERRRRSAVR
ncbi:flavodoxin domain-containing protein [Actinotalea sp. K2]|uniref:flavodoxin domain-containing protein n=1 Tax=Actinotalea sp. K2 TaxID=2939438 RepID=UPI0020176F70|nr:flavodoxin domain-containing protein [Actinotalea sp. K2]MCL3862754.1 flavodoxin domain-containing protein [Actinotalea sp. K2]